MRRKPHVFIRTVKEKEGYLGFLNIIVPSGVVSWYVKSSLSSCFARSLSFVPSTIHSPFWSASRWKYFCVVFSSL